MFLVDTAILLLISLRHVLFVPVPESKVSNATMAVGMLATVGAASGSAAGRQVPNRMREVFKLSRGGEVLREVLKAVVVPHHRLQPTGILQPVPETPTKFPRKPEAICREIRSCLPEANDPIQDTDQKTSMCTEPLIRPTVALWVSDQRRRHCHSRRRPSAIPWQKAPRGFLRVHWGGRP